jgi:hypothetical protein
VRRLASLVSALLLLGALAGAVGFVQHRRHERLTVADVVSDVAPRMWTTRRLPVGLPTLRDRGWRPMGSRADTREGRHLVTAKYWHGDETLTISRLDDTDGLDDGGGVVVRRVGDVELSWLEGAPRLTARVVVGSHQTVLTGGAPSESLRREMTHIAAALAAAAR